MDLFSLFIIVVIGIAIMYFFSDSKQVVSFILGVCAIVWFLTVLKIIPPAIHILHQ